MKNICIILGEFSFPVPASEGGAIEELIEILINENEKLGKLNLYVYCPINIRGKKFNTLYKNTKIIYINRTSLHFRLFNKIFCLINKILSRFPFYFPFLSLYYKKIFKETRKIDSPYILFEGNYDSSIYLFTRHYGKDRLYFHVHHQILKKENIDKYFGNLISVSRFIMNDWKHVLHNNEMNYYVLKNCVNENKFNNKISYKDFIELRYQLNLKKDDFVLIYCGRIIPEKGVKELLLTLRKINISSIKLLIIGSPNFSQIVKSEYMNEVKEIIDTLEDKVIFTGYIANHNLSKYYQIADLQVIPSLWEEAAGLVAIEGMLSGLPLIVTNSGGLPEYVNEKCSLIVNKENIESELINGILSIYNNKNTQEEMKRNSLNQSKLYKKNSFYNEFCSIFESMRG